jgi:hypothetical protein
MDGYNAGTNERAIQSISAGGRAPSVPGPDAFPGFPSQRYADEELIAIQDQLASLLNAAIEYPYECWLGDCAFLFESRDDIAVIVEVLEEQITRPPHRAA